MKAFDDDTITIMITAIDIYFFGGLILTKYSCTGVETLVFVHEGPRQKPLAVSRAYTPNSNLGWDTGTLSMGKSTGYYVDERGVSDAQLCMAAFQAEGSMSLRS